MFQSKPSGSATAGRRVVAITFAAVTVILFAPRSDQAHAIASEFAFGTGIAAVGAAVINFAVLPALHSEDFVILALGMGLFLAAVLVPAQLMFGHLTGDYVHKYQPAKFAAIEGRWETEQPASEVVIAWPNSAKEANDFEIKIRVLGSLIASMSFDSREVGLKDFPVQDRPPVAIPFFSFRIMVACGLAMLALAWAGPYLIWKGRLEQSRWLLWLTFLSFPLPFVATLTGWFTAEVGRQPWTVYGVLRTADAVTPFLTTRAAAISLIVYCVIYSFIFLFGIFYIYRLLRAGPAGPLIEPPLAAVPNRPMSVVHEAVAPPGARPVAGE